MSETLLLCIIIAALGTLGILELLLTLKNCRYVQKGKHRVPAFAKDYVSAATHLKACRYTVDKAYVAIVEHGMMLTITLIVIASGFLGYFDTFLAELLPVWMAESLYYRGCVYLLGLSLLSSIVGIPFQYYRQFKIEERYGFNTMTTATWLGDLVKGTVLSLVFLVPLLCGLFYFMESSGSLWWLYAWAFLMSFQLLLLFLFPVFIAPLFNTFKPLEDAALGERIQAMAEKLKFSTNGIFVMDGSRRSRHANAYFAGLGSQKRIVLFDTLIQLLSPEQILAVLAHEIGHEKKKHIVKNIILMSCISLGAFYAFSIVIDIDALYGALGFEQKNHYAALLIFSLCMEPVMTVIRPLFSFFSRSFEYEADRFALEATGGARDLSEALFKLSENSLAALQPDPWYSAWYYSHPSIGERVQAMKEAEAL